MGEYLYMGGMFFLFFTFMYGGVLHRSGNTDKGHQIYTMLLLLSSCLVYYELIHNDKHLWKFQTQSFSG